MSTIEEVKSRIDIVEIIGQYVPLKKAGRNFKAVCPFHQEKTPSFIVFPESQHYHCFGCGANGDVFTFIMQTENRTFPEALQLLARRAGVVLRPPTPQEKETDQRRERLRELNLAAAHFFHNQLWLSEAGASARAYLEERGISRETAQTFLLGYAPDEWEALSKHLKERGYSEEELLTAGLVIERDSGGSYDRFRHRLMFSIRDQQGHVIGFGGRMLDPERPPKYMNSPQTPLFDKSSVLYGLDQATVHIRKQGEAILVEGYFDVLNAHQHGYQNVTAPMGTALTESQVRLLKRLTHQLTLALDADTAGSMATLRGLEVIQEAMDKREVPVPTAHGLIRFERELDGEVRIVVLPAGQDPDQVIRANPANWGKRLKEARPVLDYILERIAQESDLTTAKGKAAAVQQALPLLAEIHDPVEQGHYVQRLAHLVQVEERAILAQLPRKRQTRKRPTRSSLQELPADLPIIFRKDETVEGYLLALLQHHPPLKDSLPPGSYSLFSREEHRVLFEALTGSTPGEDLLAGELQRYMEDLHNRFQADVDMTWELANRALEQCLDRLKVLNNERQYQHYRYMLLQAYEEGDIPLVQEMGQRLSSLSQQQGQIPTPPPSRIYPDLRRHLSEEEEPEYPFDTQ